MQYTKLGSTGLHVSRICLGTMTYGSKRWRPWVLEEAESIPLIAQAWEAGINFFDTADMYSLGVSEEILGKAIRQLGIPRDRVVIATKLFNPMGPDLNEKGLSRKHLRHAIDDSLRRLRMDYVDLYQIHRFDPDTEVEEVMGGMSDVVRDGKALYLGASSMYAWQLAKLQYAAERAGGPKFVTMQNHYNLAYREEEREMIPFCIDQRVGLIPWSPLGRGLLTGSLKKDSRDSLRAQTDEYAQKIYSHDSDFAIADRVREVAESRGVSRATVALAWLLARPGVTAPIIGASKPKHIEDAIAALDFRLEASEVARLEELYQPHPILGHS
ncbi:aldo/keto reductase [Bryobacter aggregatus]|uniref:aldo/keto reductase n=1 Tax=Bryobacter aggregatus TaxID=360054 RepID=UPI0004E18FBD|nr:aldo/keto reductase [Bryobacter aggregatus]